MLHVPAFNSLKTLQFTMLNFSDFNYFSKDDLQTSTFEPHVVHRIALNSFSRFKLFLKVEKDITLSLF